MTRRDAIAGAGAGALALGGAQVLAACGGGGSTTSPTAAPATGGEKPVRGGTLKVGWVSAGQSEVVDPAQSFTNNDLFRTQQIFDGLFTIGPDQKPKPALAESAEPNASATLWKFKIRPDVTWHDGKPLTAEDVAAAIKSWVSESNYYSAVMNNVLDAEGVKTAGKNIVEVPLKKAIAEFPSVTAFYNLLITRPDSFKAGGAIGTGPFKLKSFKPGQQTVLTANSDFWAQNGGPYVDELLIDCTYSEDTTRMNALLSGAIDVAPAIPYALAKQNAASGQISISSARGASNYAFETRLDVAPFKDSRVTQALKLLVDQQQMVDSVFAGYAAPAIHTPLGYGLPNFASDLPLGEYDPEKAKSLLKSAGQEGLKLTLNTSELVAGFVECATLFASQAKAGGVDISINKVDPSLYYTEQGPEGGYLSYPFFTGYPGGGAAIPSLTNFWLTCLWAAAPYDETHFGDPKNDALMFDAMGELDESAAAEKWRVLQEVQVESGGFIVPAGNFYVDGYGSKVRGLEATPAGWVNNFTTYPGWLES